MRQLSFTTVGFVLHAALGLADIAAAQPLLPPTIHRVTLQPDSGVLTISGRGLGPDLFVSVDGQPAPQLPGASDTHVEVLAPDTVMTTPGTFRLTVVDSARQVGDAFVVATSEASALRVTGAAPRELSGGAATEAVAPAGARRTAPARRAASVPTPVGPNLVEDANNTAVGNLAFAANTTGNYNTAIGSWSLTSNTRGHENTAVGAAALASSTTGLWNTALGVFAGSGVTTGSYNVYLGAYVSGEAADANTIRIGRPYDSYGTGQHRTFIAGIHGTQLTGPAAPVFVNANGQLGTRTPPTAIGRGNTPVPFAFEQQLPDRQAINTEQQAINAEQQATIAELRARLARLEAMLTAGAPRR